MSGWYLRDGRGAVVGPIGRDVALDLLRSRPGVFVYLSEDGSSWTTVRSDLVQSLIGQEGAEDRSAREREQVERTLLELDRFREMAPHELFGVRENAPLKDFRAAFLVLAKRYHPGRLSLDVSPELLRANMSVYQHLSEVMTRAERAFAQRTPPPQTRQKWPGTPQPARVAETRAAPLWTLDRLHLKHQPHAMQGSLEINRETSLIFWVHRLINLPNRGCFFPCAPTLPLGTRLDLSFRFPDAQREVRTRGAVSLESTEMDKQQKLRGFGVQLDGLSPSDKDFMLAEVSRLQPR